ncbi:helix-turn-helix domain-containing protein [Rhodococcus rhodochrous]|uniref:Helix-turn-helix domain-containing protein n=1 Tax=Rhodococcus rhodochrous TaxID=1829 RepID=A0AAW4XE71_RHORH|nr:helix-turn-helix domain-containing protein [Rhodococcus rhodochrous]MCD2111410.1 helix-turn-helix domain-containing protein [Rhodococcus rhodochrous]
MQNARITPASVTLAGTAAICAAAFWLSYEALTDLANRSGITTPWLWPLIVDGLVVVATVAVVAGVSRYAWGLLIAGAAVSVAGNVLHAVLPDGVLPVWLRATVAAVPPVALVAVTHLAVVLRRAHSILHRDAVADATTRPTEPRSYAEPPQISARDLARCDATASPETDDLTALAESSEEELSPSHLHVLDAPGAPRVKADDDAGDIRAKAVAMLSQGTPVCDIADELGVHRATIYRWRASTS